MAIHIRRREFIVALGGAATGWPFATHAQQPPRMKRLAVFSAAAKLDAMRIGGDPGWTLFFEEIKRLGYVEGVNLIVDRYSAEGWAFDRLPEIARDVVATRPDVIYAPSTAVVVALQSETRTIPIVALTGDPLPDGIVSSLARPGGNITGVSVDAGVESYGKFIEFLTEAVGRLANVRLLATLPAWHSSFGKAMRDAAKKLNVPLRLEPLQTPINETEYRRAFDAMQRDHVDGVVSSAEPVNNVNRLLLGRLAQQYRLPVICSYRDSVEAGALMSYAFDLKAASRRGAAQIVEILNGGNPAEMPFFQETHWELVINLKAAKKLGLKIPAGLIAGADAVIE